MKQRSRWPRFISHQVGDSLIEKRPLHRHSMFPLRVCRRGVFELKGVDGSAYVVAAALEASPEGQRVVGIIGKARFVELDLTTKTSRLSTAPLVVKETTCPFFLSATLLSRQTLAVNSVFPEPIGPITRIRLAGVMKS